MSILISTKPFYGSKSFGSFFFDGLTFKSYSENISYCLHGEVFNYSEPELVSIALSNTTGHLSKVRGEYFLIVVFSAEDRILYFTDRSGRELLYCSTKAGFSLADDFWSLVRHDSYSLMDIDSINLKIQLFFSATPDHSSILKGLFLVSNAIIGEYKNGGVKENRYWRFSMKENNNISEEDKYDAIQDTFDQVFTDIRSKNSIDTVFGLGLSGGMDSRVIPYFAKRHDMILKPFIIGDRYPHKVLLSNDHKSADKIADYYDLKLVDYYYNNLSYTEKNKIDVINSPMVSSQIFKITDPNMHRFDALLTGASGFIVGSSPFYTKNRYLDIMSMVFTQQSDIQIKPSFYKLKKALNYILGTPYNIFGRNIIPEDGLLSNDDIEKIANRFSAYFFEMSSMNNTEKLMNYAIEILGQRNKQGAFESLSNSKKSYTPYTSSFLDVISTWSDEDLYDRRIFEKYIQNRLSFIANIKAQDYKVTYRQNKSSKVMKFLSVAEYVVRGNGVMNYNNWAKQKIFMKFVGNELMKNNYIKEYINVENVISLTKRGFLDSAVLTGSIKLNSILRKIDKQEKEFEGEKSF